MGLTLTIKSSREYAKAISGLFISKKNPSGLTSKEIEIVAKLMEHCKQGIITSSARQASMEELKMKKQNFYNAMSVLKGKQVITGEELNKVFTTDTIRINNANSN